MYCSLHRSLSAVFQEQDILGNAFKEKRYLKVTEKEEAEADKQWTDNRQFRLCTPLMHRITGSRRVLCPKTTPRRRPSPSTSWLKVQNSYHCPQIDKEIQCIVCSTKGKPGKDL